MYELDESTGVQRSVDIAGTSVSCSSDIQGMTIAENRLLVPVGNDLVVY